MVENDISPFFVLKKIRDGEELRMDQKHIKIRMNSDKVMAIHYKAPMERTIELEMFFDKFNPIDRINYNIGGTGWVGANFRGIIDGKDDSTLEQYLSDENSSFLDTQNIEVNNKKKCQKCCLK